MWAGISTDPLARVRSKQRPTKDCSRCERIQGGRKVLGSPEDWPGYERLEKKAEELKAGARVLGRDDGKGDRRMCFLDLRPWA